MRRLMAAEPLGHHLERPLPRCDEQLAGSRDAADQTARHECEGNARRDGERVFGGYKVGKDGVPTFLYRQDGQQVEDTLRPVKNGFERSVKINGKETKEELSW
jgi:hypothetical protein